MNGIDGDQIYRDVLRWIPPSAATVLEIGCGTGQLARSYKQINPFVRYMGIEWSATAAAIAEKTIETVLCGDVESMSLQEKALEGKIDCLIYRDALAQLRDPWRILKEHAELLSDDGQVIACIPNVQHWTVLANLLAGHWRYADNGLLDRTHLRFFTLESIREMFAQAGLHIYEIIPRLFDHPQRDKIQGILAEAGKALGLEDTQNGRVQTAAMQYVVRATKKPVESPLLLHALLGETKVCSRVRISEPHAFCATKPGVRVAENVQTVTWPAERPGEKKVFFWQRVSPPSFEAQAALIQRGYLIIYEIDDDPYRWRESYERNDYLAFRSCHAVQVSTEPLAEFIRQYNPHVAVFPNQLAVLPPPREYLEEPVHLFFGALNREQDWPELIPYINECLKMVPHTVTVLHDRQFFNALTTEHKNFVPFCPYQQYQQLLSQAHIAFLPLADIRFNRMKSDLKFLECAAHGVVALASPVVYGDSIQDGKTGVLYRSPREFGDKLALLLQDGQRRRDIAGQAYQWVRDNRMLCRHYSKRLEWYQQLHANYDSLTAEIYQRVKNSKFTVR